MEIRFLHDVETEVMRAAFLRAFSDYMVPFQPTPEQFQDLITRRGVDPGISIGAFEEGQLIAFNLNGIGMYSGSITIYDSGTGTAPEFRRRGIAEELFRLSLPVLKDRGASEYLLEVFQQNTPAVRLYERIGFQILRNLGAFRRNDALPRNPDQDSPFVVQEMEPDWDAFQKFWDWSPAWQNSIVSIQRSKMKHVVLGVYLDGNLAGYGIIFPESGDIPQFCIDRNYRGRGAATILLHELQNRAPAAKLRMINMDSSDAAFARFLAKHEFELIVTQFEMNMTL